MATETAIEWCDSTFNPWTGCTKISPACDHCYAEDWAKRSGIVQWGNHPRRRTTEAAWREPLRWQREAAAFFELHGRRRRVFCASLADVFDNQVDPAWRKDLFTMIRATPELEWLLLTKRPGNIGEMVEAAGGRANNVAFGATMVNQPELDRDLAKLIEVKRYLRPNFIFGSLEPLISLITLPIIHDHCDLCGGTGMLGRWPHGVCHICRGRGKISLISDATYRDGYFGLDWVIAGGESGHGARPVHPDWIRDLRDQCASVAVPFLFKQWGAWKPVLDRGKDDPDWREDYSRKFADNGKHQWLNLAGGRGFHGERFHVMRRMNKNLAGNELDGRQHLEFPVGRYADPVFRQAKLAL
jgi:protein gp37